MSFYIWEERDLYLKRFDNRTPRVIVFKNSIKIMPQLEIDLFEDFLFFAFVSLLLGLGDEDIEENLIDTVTDAYLFNFYFVKSEEMSLDRQLVNQFTTISK